MASAVDVNEVELMTFTNYDSHLYKSFTGMFCKKELTDTILICEERAIHVHKFLLSASSAFFDDMFKKHPGDCELPISIVNYDDLMLVLEYIYNGRVQLHSNKVSSFTDATNKLLVSIDFDELQMASITSEQNEDDVEDSFRFVQDLIDIGSKCSGKSTTVDTNSKRNPTISRNKHASDDSTDRCKNNQALGVVVVSRDEFFQRMFEVKNVSWPPNMSNGTLHKSTQKPIHQMTDSSHTSDEAMDESSETESDSKVDTHSGSQNSVNKFKPISIISSRLNNMCAPSTSKNSTNPINSVTVRPKSRKVLKAQMNTIYMEMAETKSWAKRENLGRHLRFLKKELEEMKLSKAKQSKSSVNPQSSQRSKKEIDFDMQLIHKELHSEKNINITRKKELTQRLGQLKVERNNLKHQQTIVKMPDPAEISLPSTSNDDEKSIESTRGKLASLHRAIERAVKNGCSSEVIRQKKRELKNLEIQQKEQRRQQNKREQTSIQLRREIQDQKPSTTLRRSDLTEVNENLPSTSDLNPKIGKKKLQTFISLLLKDIAQAINDGYQAEEIATKQHQLKVLEQLKSEQKQQRIEKRQVRKKMKELKNAAHHLSNTQTK